MSILFAQITLTLRVALYLAILLMLTSNSVFADDDNSSGCSQLIQQYNLLSSEFNNLEREIPELKLQIEDLMAENIELSSGYKKCQQTKLVCKNNLNACQQSVVPIQPVIDPKIKQQMQDEIDRLSDQLLIIRSENAKLLTQNKQLVDSELKLKNRIADILVQYGAIQDQLDTAKIKIIQGERNSAEMTDTISKLQEGNSKLVNENNVLRDQIRDLEQKTKSCAANEGLSQQLAMCEDSRKQIALSDLPSGPCGPIGIDTTQSSIILTGTLNEQAKLAPKLAELQQTYPNRKIDTTGIKISDFCEKVLGGSGMVLLVDGQGAIRLQKLKLERYMFDRLPDVTSCENMGTQLTNEVMSLFTDFDENPQFNRFWVKNEDKEVFACTLTTSGWASDGINTDTVDFANIILKFEE